MGHVSLQVSLFLIFKWVLSKVIISLIKSCIEL